MIPAEVSAALGDVLVQGIRSGRRPDHDRKLLAELLNTDQESLAAWFPDQDALFVHAVQTLLADFGQVLRAAHSSTDGADHAYLWTSIPAPDAAQRVEPEPKAAALMLLILCNDAALREARQEFESWQRLVCDDAGSAAEAMLFRILADGWWFIHAFGLGELPPGTDRHRLRQRLADITGSTPR